MQQQIVSSGNIMWQPHRQQQEDYIKIYAVHCSFDIFTYTAHLYLPFTVHVRNRFIPCVCNC